MKRLISLFAVALVVFLAFTACKEDPVPGGKDEPEKEDPNKEDPNKEDPNKQEPPAGLVITAGVSAEDSGSRNILASWVAGDEIFGFTSEGTAVSFKVESVNSSTKVATLSQTTSVDISDGMVFHAIYCPGKTAESLEGQTLSVDFSEQVANKAPVLLLSTATVSNNALTFDFVSAVSVIGIKDPVFPKASTADKLINITVSGHEIVSSGVVSLSGGSLVFTGNAPDKFIIKTLNVAPVVNGESFTVDSPVYIVVPSCKVSNISAIDNRNNFFVLNYDNTVEASKYYELNGETFPAFATPLPVSTNVASGGVVWAKANLGGTGVTDMGDIYRWSDIGKIYTERTGTTSVAFDENHSAGFNSYEGECYLSGGVYTKYNRTDNKTVLDPVDDIVCLTFPGTGWRMPTVDDFKALFAAPNEVTYNSGTANNVGTTITQGEHSVFFRGTTQVCAPSSKDKTTIGKRGRYWTSTIEAANFNDIGGNPDYIQFNGSDGRTAAAPSIETAYRHSGYCIRPVKPE